jgi:hypothetical protein
MLGGSQGLESGRAPGLGRFVLEGYGRLSLGALGLLVLAGAAVGYRWSDLVDTSGVLDQLLLTIWVGMAAAITWNVRPRYDLRLVLVGLVGGGMIEWWGTNTGLWSYFTSERPPLWILPAWPAAALTIDRGRALLDRLVDERGPCPVRPFRVAYHLLLPGFAICMLGFLTPSLERGASWVVVGLMTLVVLRCPAPRRDVLLFVSGTVAGLFLEYWGTSRECWTYYTRQIPPPITVAAHGFASVAFARVADAVERWEGSAARSLGSLRSSALGRLLELLSSAPGRG